MPIEINRTAPAGPNFLVAALVGVALAMTRIQISGFVFFLTGSGVFLIVGILSLWLKAKETVRVDLAIKIVLLLLIAGGMALVRFELLLNNPYAPLKLIQYAYSFPCPAGRFGGGWGNQRVGRWSIRAVLLKYPDITNRT